MCNSEKDFDKNAEDLKVVLYDEEGNEASFEFIDLIEYNGREFVVLLPENDEEGEVVILEIEYTNDKEEGYISIDSEETLMAVFEIFREKNKDRFNFVD